MLDIPENLDLGHALPSSPPGSAARDRAMRAPRENEQQRKRDEHFGALDGRVEKCCAAEAHIEPETSRKLSRT